MASLTEFGGREGFETEGNWESRKEWSKDLARTWEEREREIIEA